MSRRHLQPVPSRVNDETVKKLRELLASAERGETLGLLFVQVCATTYTFDAIGEARSRATFMRGTLGDLDDLLVEYRDADHRRRR